MLRALSCSCAFSGALPLEGDGRARESQLQVLSVASQCPAAVTQVAPPRPCPSLRACVAISADLQEPLNYSVATPQRLGVPSRGALDSWGLTSSSGMFRVAFIGASPVGTNAPQCGQGSPLTQYGNDPVLVRYTSLHIWPSRTQKAAARRLSRPPSLRSQHVRNGWTRCAPLERHRAPSRPCSPRRAIAARSVLAPGSSHQRLTSCATDARRRTGHNTALQVPGLDLARVAGAA